MRLSKLLIIGVWIGLVSFVAFAQKKTVPKAKPASPNKQWESNACLSASRLLSAATFGDVNDFTRSDALKVRLDIQNANSFDILPCCPETFTDTEESDLWEESSALLSCYHPGAETSVRTSEWFHNVVNSYRSGQQCTYDKRGTLIVSGAGAGTPDFVSPNAENGKSDHWKFDVFPWTRLTLAEYNSVWKPNPGCNSRITYSLQPDTWTNIWMYVRRGDVLSFTATGKVKFDVEGNLTGPEGSLVIPKTDVGFFGRLIAPNPLPTAPPGALIGAIFQGGFDNENQSFEFNDITEPFLIGKGTIGIIKADGYLLFGVNDGYLPNNSGGFQVTVKREKR